MRRGHVRHLPVLEGDRLVGMLALRDLVSPVREAPHATVRAVMTCAPLVLVEPAADAAGAGRLLLRRRVGALPVVEDGRLLGILTKTDYLSQIADLQIPLPSEAHLASAPVQEGA